MTMLVVVLRYVIEFILFQTLFQTNPCKHPIVFLKDVKGQELEALIEFIYKGEVRLQNLFMKVYCA